MRRLLDRARTGGTSVSRPLSPDPTPATPADLRRAQERDRLLRTELPRVRAAATAWRNGLGGLLAALVGFSLVRGRSDIGQLAEHWAVAVGFLLLAALVVGTSGALMLLRAAHGRPAVTAAEDLLPSPVGDHVEALDCAKALRRGIALTLACALLLLSAVATTWYGPERADPMTQVTTPSGTFCGSTVRVGHGTLVLRTAAGEVTVDLARVSALSAATACP
ncbi:MULTISPECIES: hypothetical protein [Streptomyces]|uniref:hypothetical protein n=1 Tax=Streptomyces TaxID=1883 RepID=UPI000689F945|nr:hypothetical protein [Streptomyces durhamensis]